MKSFLLPMLVAAPFALLPVLAQAELSYNIGITSLYKFNGVDQDNPKGKSIRPALQGGVDMEFGSGFFLGNWNSTGKFGDADLEIDLYGGYRGKINDNMGYAFGAGTYVYPGSGGGWNATDAFASLRFGPVTAKYSHGLGGSLDKFGRFSLAHTYALTEALSLNTKVGFRNKAAGSFKDFSVGMGYDMGSGLSTSVEYTGATKKLGGAGDKRLVVGLIKGF